MVEGSDAADFIGAESVAPTKPSAWSADPSVLYLERIGSPMLHWFVIEGFAAAAQLVLELGMPVAW